MNSLIISFPKSEFDRVVMKKEKEIIENRRVFLQGTEAFRDKGRAA